MSSSAASVPLMKLIIPAFREMQTDIFLHSFTASASPRRYLFLHHEVMRKQLQRFFVSDRIFQIQRPRKNNGAILACKKKIYEFAYNHGFPPSIFCNHALHSKQDNMSSSGALPVTQQQYQTHNTAKILLQIKQVNDRSQSKERAFPQILCLKGMVQLWFSAQLTLPLPFYPKCYLVTLTLK